MLETRRIEVRGEPIVWADRSVTLVARTWLVSAGARTFALGGWYRRPLRIEVAGRAPDQIPIRDHTMMVRLAGAALFVTAVVFRRFR